LHYERWFKLNLHFPHRLLLALFKLAVECDVLIDRQRFENLC